MLLLLLIWLHVNVSDIDIFIVAQQLVQFLLKQAGVDKRTGDLYGNRDLMNIARNMARGLKVCIELLRLLYNMLDNVSLQSQKSCFPSFAAGC